MKVKFGTDGFRGYIGKDFTFNTAIEASVKALNYFYKKNSSNIVAIGYDTRFLSKEVADEIAFQAMNYGYHVYLSECFVPSPALSLFVSKKKLNFGLMITASHNPPQFNGVKIKENFGGSALPATINAISNSKNCLTKSQGSIKKVSISEFYIKYLREKLPIETIFNLPKKILINPMYGAGQGIFPLLFKDTNLKIKEINNIINPSFGGINPEPIEENLKDTKDILLKERFDIAFAFDGDGDRISAFDEYGNYYSTQKLLPLFLHNLLKKGKKGYVIKTVSTTSLLNIIAKKNNLILKEVPIGFKNIVPFFLEKKALIGGEESGGMSIAGYIPERDGIYVALMLLSIIAEEKKSLSELNSEVEETYGKLYFKREDYHFSNEDKIRNILSNIDFDKVAKYKVIQKNFLDGRKFILSDGSFLLFRVSGTEPVIRIYGEAESLEKLEEIFYFAQKKLKVYGISK